MTERPRAALRAKLIAAVALLALAAGACSSSQRDAGPDGAAPNTSAPLDGGGKPGTGYDDTYNFTATTFDGERFELAEHKGTPVVINFWESW